jgi:hypothetical protein
MLMLAEVLALCLRVVMVVMVAAPDQLPFPYAFFEALVVW